MLFQIFLKQHACAISKSEIALRGISGEIALGGISGEIALRGISGDIIQYFGYSHHYLEHYKDSSVANHTHFKVLNTMKHSQKCRSCVCLLKTFSEKPSSPQKLKICSFQSLKTRFKAFLLVFQRLQAQVNDQGAQEN